MRDKTAVGPFSPLFIPMMTSLCMGGVTVGGPKGWGSRLVTKPRGDPASCRGRGGSRAVPFEDSPLSTVGAGTCVFGVRVCKEVVKVK